MLLREQEVRQRLQRDIINKGLGSVPSVEQRRVFAEGLYESSSTYQKSKEAQTKEFDIFLSHSSKDKELVMGTKLILEDLGFSVYVDWIEDPQMNRSKVTKDTAEKLQERMKKCKSLFYAFSSNSGESRWMPWECGYFDGIKNGRVAILPISSNGDRSFKGTEYLGLYYYITVENDSFQKSRIWINESEKVYVSYENWMKNEKPYIHKQ